MLNGVDAALLAFCEPWLAREPRLLLACQFAPEGMDRARFLATQVLVRELAQTAIAVSDRRVAEAKLAWWADEASFWAQGHPRHPLAHGVDPRLSARPLAALLACVENWLATAQAFLETHGEVALHTRVVDVEPRLHGQAPAVTSETCAGEIHLGLPVRQIQLAPVLCVRRCSASLPGGMSQGIGGDGGEVEALHPCLQGRLGR